MNQEPLKPDFKDVPIELLEQLRMRLSQLTHSLNKLQIDMSQSTTLPQWSSLQNQLSVIISQLTSLSSTIDSHIKTLAATDVFPINTFPTSQQEGLLTTLLRKKHLPEINSWITDSLKQVEKIDLTKDDKWCGWCLSKLETEIANFNFVEQAEQLETKVEQEQKLTIDQIYKFMYQGVRP